MLPNKAQATYHEMWTKIKELKLGLTPRSMQIDFEWASRNAINESFQKFSCFVVFFILAIRYGEKLRKKDCTDIVLKTKIFVHLMNRSSL